MLGGATAKCISDTTGFGAIGACAGNTYMANVPSNTTPGGIDYTYRSVDAAGADCGTGPCIGYSLRFDLEADTGELKDGTDALTVPNCTATPGGITCL